MNDLNTGVIAAFARNFFREQLLVADRPQGRAEGWSVQGFGMLRFHLSDEYRINVWDSTYRVPNVSDIHTHPWDFSSRVLLGTFKNERFIRGDERGPFVMYDETRITPGDKGGAIQPVGPALLRSLGVEVYGAGETYHQLAEEIHRSLPDDFAVTINQRRRVGADEASVFHPREWVPAKPRQATRQELWNTLSALFARHPELHGG